MSIFNLAVWCSCLNCCCSWCCLWACLSVTMPGRRRRRKVKVAFPCGVCSHDTEDTRSIECEVCTKKMNDFFFFFLTARAGRVRRPLFGCLSIYWTLSITLCSWSFFILLDVGSKECIQLRWFFVKESFIFRMRVSYREILIFSCLQGKQPLTEITQHWAVVVSLWQGTSASALD